MSRIEALAGVTIVVPDLQAAIAAYRDWLGYVPGRVAVVGDALAAQWGAPGAAAARTVTLCPESGETRFIRLVEGQADPGYQPLTSLGWIAAEIIVQDVDALAERLGAEACPFKIIGPPAVLDFEFTDQIKAMQVVGPGGETLYLTEVGAPIPGFDLPAAESFVGALFIMVLGARDIADAATHYASPRHPLGPVFEARIEVLSTAFDMPTSHRYRLATVAFGESTLIEIDAFPPHAPIRALSTVGMPSGIAVVSFLGVSPQSRMTGTAGEWFEIIANPPVR
ncbi:hypothetical protein [Sphingomonas sp.]|uniref:hypothetical protein n=1 Tax=Sphingomonas sp. TaxID=28214 RepID=UPI0025D4E1AA|nr:hypothetical protein [Sphingomonas sp.]